MLCLCLQRQHYQGGLLGFGKHKNSSETQLFIKAPFCLIAEMMFMVEVRDLMRGHSTDTVNRALGLYAYGVSMQAYPI